MDGFRALAYIDSGKCELVSRKGNVFKSFAPLCAELAKLERSVILDGEIVCLDSVGKPQFYDLLRHRRDPIFYAFDVLWLDGEDLRSQQTLERKLILKELVRNQTSILYARHFVKRGIDLFRVVCEQDLEGIVAKHCLAPYGSEEMPWIKVLNPNYSQREGRRELFDKRRAAGS